MFANGPQKATTFYMKLTGAKNRHGSDLLPIRHAPMLDSRGDLVDQQRTFVPRHIKLDSGTWTDTENFAKSMLEQIEWDGPALRPFHYLFMVTSYGRSSQGTAVLAAISTTRIDDIRVAESPDAPIITRSDSFLQIAAGLVNRSGRPVIEVDL
ncbi:MAG: hypothetical protein KDD62_11480 [Bdellovibrionales bacterium]|nr:hypothetical protein [Bdellovibrionales bacterium]